MQQTTSSKEAIHGEWSQILRLAIQLPLCCSLASALLHAQVDDGPTPSPIPQEDASDNALISDRESVDLIGDSNVAEALSRRPDLQFSNLTIDGERSNLSLTDIPSDAVSEIELLRAVTADLDADSRGGSLNLSFSPTFQLEKPVTQLDAWARYAMGEDTWMQGASASYSRAIGDLGYRIQASHSHGNDTFEGYYLNWSRQDEPSTVYTPNYLIQNRESERQQTQNLGAALDYRFSDSLHAFVRLNSGRRERDVYQARILYHFSRGTYQVAQSTLGTVEASYVDRDLISYETEWTQADFLSGLVYEGEAWRADIRVLGEFQRYREPDWMELQFRTDPVALAYQLNERYLPLVQSASADLQDARQFHFDELVRERWSQDHDRWVSSANLRYDFEFRGHQAYLKTGIKWTQRIKDQYGDSRIYTGYDGTFTLAQLAHETGFESLLVDGVSWGAFPTPDNARAFVADHDSRFLYDRTRSALKADPATYRAQEQLSAAYAMLNIKGQRLRTILGFRVEKSTLDYQAKTVVIDAMGNYVATEPSVGTNDYTDWFPSLHLRYFLGSRTTLIASWTGTIERPYFGYTVPFRYIDYNSREITEGNPQLKPTLYHNLDATLDIKLSDSSLLSLELFSRKANDIVFWEVSRIREGQFEGFTRGTHANGPSATERGLRLVVTQDLRDLSQSLEGFKLRLKYSFQDSETQYPGRESETLPVTYRPRNRYEATLSYQGPKLYLQLEYAYEDAELVAVYGTSWQDRYEIPQEHLSLRTSYQWNTFTRFYCDISGLLESYAKTYYGDPSRPSGVAWRSKKLELGVKIRI